MAREAGHDIKVEDLEELNDDPDMDIPNSYDTFDMVNRRNKDEENF